VPPPGPLDGAAVALELDGAVVALELGSVACPACPVPDGALWLSVAVAALDGGLLTDEPAG
jgi:hypothetical protein